MSDGSWIRGISAGSSTGGMSLGSWTRGMSFGNFTLGTSLGNGTVGISLGRGTGGMLDGIGRVGIGFSGAADCVHLAPQPIVMASVANAMLNTAIPCSAVRLGGETFLRRGAHSSFVLIWPTP